MIFIKYYMKPEKIFKMPYKRIPFVSNLFRRRIEICIQFASLNDNRVILDVGCRDGYLLKTIRNYNQSCKCYGIEKKNSKWSINPYY